ncbi:hypothetical protein [Caulobacter sp. BK020]|uniref:hypothetical protein n=1 Tax=Caulobacter sp. BK020 TaxID=2512117 RepID=UPI00104C7092|nr:hypothetical protein [Caulobacter sp. BK020]
MLLVASLSLAGCASPQWTRIEAGAAPLSTARAKCRPAKQPDEVMVEAEERLAAWDRCMEGQGWARPETLLARKG